MELRGLVDARLAAYPGDGLRSRGTASRSAPGSTARSASARTRPRSRRCTRGPTIRTRSPAPRRCARSAGAPTRPSSTASANSRSPIRTPKSAARRPGRSSESSATGPGTANGRRSRPANRAPPPSFTNSWPPDCPHSPTRWRSTAAGPTTASPRAHRGAGARGPAPRPRRAGRNYDYCSPRRRPSRRTPICAHRRRRAGRLHRARRRGLRGASGAPPARARDRRPAPTSPHRLVVGPGDLGVMNPRGRPRPDRSHAPATSES
ncbi:hypothetical protein SAMN02745121_05530 [Nannocystis exedens]|uniref:Uncharacterized protein n=1 Tax=Nannocystis exedens TaxID=54 RepID=A0A1I2DD21_9BACT|nr:hypothetical protein NAEX_03649 [Nannocystis exedens]SFE78359.1 hypothetical protein SAMN02745121_05530 [Nannocystis exedens]